MKGRNYKAFIVEGEAREPQIISNLCKIHFKDCNFKIITLPAGQNIYMLWQKMKEDDFDTDIIEILRETSRELEGTLADLTRDDFSEIFLFFDYDGHQNNLPAKLGMTDAVNSMLLNFDNETENGKLYISYPMVEALRDFSSNVCGNVQNCYCALDQFENYKNRSVRREMYTDFRKYSFEIWRQLLNVFVMRISCLLNSSEIIKYDTYKDVVTPLLIYKCQQNHIAEGNVFILSAFPEFLLDYFSIKFWNSCIKCSKRSVKNCKD